MFLLYFFLTTTCNILSCVRRDRGYVRAYKCICRCRRGLVRAYKCQGRTMQFSFRKRLIINGTRLGRRRPNCSRNGARPNGGRIHKPLVHNFLCHVQGQPYSVCGHLSEATERRMRRPRSRGTATAPSANPPLRLSVPGRTCCGGEGSICPLPRRERVCMIHLSGLNCAS